MGRQTKGKPRRKRAQATKPRRGSYALLALCAGALLCLPGEPNCPAKILPGTDHLVGATEIGPEGGVLRIGKLGTPADKCLVRVPKGALTDRTELSLWYNTGQLTNYHGRWDGTVLRIKTKARQFARPVEMQISTGQSPNEKIRAYVQNDWGRVQAAQRGPESQSLGRASFNIAGPGLIAWVHETEPPKSGQGKR